MAMIFGDYVAGFLGLGRDGCTWSMNPFDVSLPLDAIHSEALNEPCHCRLQPIKTKDGEVVGRGDGNQCSAEFNVLYRVRRAMSTIHPQCLDPHPYVV